MKKFLSFVLLCFLTASFLPAQSEVVFDSSYLSYSENSSDQASPKTWSERKHYGVALVGALGWDVLLATWNRYMIGSNWAKTGPDEWFHFWEREASWDRDWYWTNFFLHPYQGSMYYMACRGSNLNYLESFAITVLGSSAWEYLCEKNAPSKNDMMFTTVGAFSVGEMFFRLGQEADSINRLLGVAINPQRLWTEYVCQIKQKPTTGNIYSMSVGVDIGSAVSKTEVMNSSFGFDYPSREVYPVLGGIDFSVDYNDPYRHDSNTPYEQFTMDVHGSIGRGSGYTSYCSYQEEDKKLGYNIRMLSDGMLFARMLNCGENTDTTMGASMIFDFDWHSFYMLSSMAPCFAFKQRYNKQDSSIEWQAHAGVILLGNTEYFYYHRQVIPEPDELICCYNNTMGAQTLLKFKYKTDSGWVAAVDFRGYAMYDFKDQLQTGCDTGWEFVGLASARVEAPVSKKVRIGVADEIYSKVTKFDEVPDYWRVLNTAKVFAKLQLK